MVEKDNVGMEKSAFGRVFGDMSMITTEPAYTKLLRSRNLGVAEVEASYLPVSRPKPEGLRQGNEVAAEFRMSLIIF